MTPGALAVTAPLVIALLVWWMSRKKGKPGRSLPTFLLGYVTFFTYVGLSDFPAHRFHHTTPIDYIYFIVGMTLACYLFGAIGWLFLTGLKDRLSSALQWWLTTHDSPESEATEVTSVPSVDVEAAVQRSRQQTIEECAEKAYEYFMDDVVGVGVDYDRVQRTAGRLRDAILALGGTV